MRYAIIIALTVLTAGCGSYGRKVANWTGWSRWCVNGVSYLQFSSGVTVEYTPDGKVATCK